MTGARELFQLQEIDTEIDAGKRRLVQVEDELQEDAELMAARSELQTREDRLRSLEADQKSLEWDVENTRTRMASLETRMYGNQVGNPRELKSIDTEIGHLKERQGSLEDRVLSTMEMVEEARREEESQRAVVEEMEALWASAQSSLLEEKSRLETEMPGWEEKRLQYASALPESSARLYERLRSAKAGLAVARVERGTCSACRITLPMTLAQGARSDKQVTYCSSCGRVLFASG